MKRERDKDDYTDEGTPVQARHELNRCRENRHRSEEETETLNQASSAAGSRLAGAALSVSPSIVGEDPGSPSLRPPFPGPSMGGSSAVASNQLLSALLQQQGGGGASIDQLSLLDARLQLENQLLLQHLIGTNPLAGARGVLNNPTLSTANSFGNLSTSSLSTLLASHQLQRSPSLLNNDFLLAQLLPRLTLPSSSTDQQLELLRRELASSQAAVGSAGGLSGGSLSSSILQSRGSGFSALGLGAGAASSTPSLSIAHLTALLSDSTESDLSNANKLPFETEERAVSLYSDSDDEKLSPYQIKVREQLEYFVAQEEDVDSSIQGRKKQVKSGQVGIRCIHCCHIPIRCRSRGAVYYPARLNGVYQAAQNMANSHLLDSCDMISEDVRKELKKLRERGDTATGGKAYWAETCQKVGIYEIEEGLRLLPANVLANKTG